MSRDGHEYTKQHGLKSGLPTQAVVKPERRIFSPNDTWEVIVIGGGYAGLIAARDLVKAGRYKNAL